MGFGFSIMFYGDMFNEPTIEQSAILSMKYDAFYSSWNVKNIYSFPLFSNMNEYQDSVENLVFQKSKIMI